MYNNKTLERDLPSLDKSNTPRLGSIGGASIEVDNTSYIYNGLGKVKDRNEDYIKLLKYLGILGEFDTFVFV